MISIVPYSLWFRDTFRKICHKEAHCYCCFYFTLLDLPSSLWSPSCPSQFHIPLFPSQTLHSREISLSTESPISVSMETAFSGWCLVLGASWLLMWRQCWYCLGDIGVLMNIVHTRRSWVCAQRDIRKMKGFQRREITPNRGRKGEASGKKRPQHWALESRPDWPSCQGPCTCERPTSAPIYLGPAQFMGQSKHTYC